MNSSHPEKALTIPELIDLGNKCELTLATSSLYYRTGDVIYPIESIYTEYLNIIEPMCVSVTLTDSDMEKYRYKPRALSLEIYNTIELWFFILIINRMKSTLEFNRRKLVLLPKDKLNVLSEIISNNKTKLNSNRETVGLSNLKK